MAVLSLPDTSDNRIDALPARMSHLQFASSNEPAELIKPFSEFTLFPQLATEIRLKIWELALPIPDNRLRRMIQVKGWVSTILKVHGT